MPVVKKTKKKMPVVKKKRTRNKSVVDKTSAGSVEKPRRPQGNAAAKATTSATVDEQKLTPAAPELDAVEAVGAVEPARAPDRDIREPPRTDTEPKREPVNTAPAVSEPVQKPMVAAPTNGGMRNGVWIRALDTARKYDLFDLNRVPIDKSLRGRDHQHTWDHRVATAEGVAGRVCTICGKIRLSTSPGGRPRRSRR